MVDAVIDLILVAHDYGRVYEGSSKGTMRGEINYSV